MPGQTHKKGKLILVLGGARSGKSGYAQRLVESACRHPLYLATAEALDTEMRARIRRHRRKRGARWGCLEEPLDVARALGRRPARCDGVLLECATLWLSNVLLKEGRAAIPRRKAALLRALRAAAGLVVVVSNEVGMGIVPDNALARQFRDQAGWLNQELAAAADAVVLVTAGLPQLLKGTV
jgi:adenosylcobinamide kinase/adenosylcobinamide-phosphate guanylyltransferase